jgi:hypothetical protein
MAVEGPPRGRSWYEGYPLSELPELGSLQRLFLSAPAWSKNLVSSPVAHGPPSFKPPPVVPIESPEQVL